MWRDMAYRSFEELEVWKRGCQVAIQVYEVVRESRDFSLRDQMQRAAVSIPSNIAEGAERGGRTLSDSCVSHAVPLPNSVPNVTLQPKSAFLPPNR